MIVAHPMFWIVATMNADGDFGKRELTPAMHNQFTEMCVPSFEVSADLDQIIEEMHISPIPAEFKVMTP